MNEPWNTEPDEVHFIEHGYECRVVRHDVLGFLCGYVGVPATPPYFSVGYDDLPTDLSAQNDAHQLAAGEYYMVVKDTDTKCWIGHQKVTIE